MYYHICELEGAVQQEALGSASQQDLMSDHGAAQNLPVKYGQCRHEYSLDAVRKTQCKGEMLRYLRAASPSIPSSGLGGSLDRAWDRKSRGTAHQCFELSSWIIFSKMLPTAQLQHDSLEETQRKNV